MGAVLLFLVQVDVVVTKDNHAVLLHDATINRTSNGFGFACDMTLEQLQQFDFGILHRYIQYCIPTTVI